MPPDRIVNSMAKGKKLRQLSGADLVARLWQLYVEYRLDGTRRPAQDGHAIASLQPVRDNPIGSDAVTDLVRGARR